MSETESKKDENKPEEDSVTIQQKDKTGIDEKASLWNQLRITWKDYQDLKYKIAGQIADKITREEKQRYERELAGFEFTIENLLVGLKTKKLEDKEQQELYNVLVRVPELKYKYGDEDVEESRASSDKLKKELDNRKEKTAVRDYIIVVLSVFAGILIATTIADLNYVENSYNYHEWNWFVYIGFGALALFCILRHTMNLEKPKQFSRLRIWEFFALSVLVVSLVMGVILFPTTIFPDDMTVKKIQKIEVIEENVTSSQWIISIGGIKDTTEESGMEIPIYILVAGSVGAYIRYLYGYIKGETREEEKSLKKLKELFQDSKKVVNSLCIAAGLEYDYIRKYEPKAQIIGKKHMHKHYDKNREQIYCIPPHARKKLAKDVADYYNVLYSVENKFDQLLFLLRSKIYTRTIQTIAAFFLAPLLAIIAWLFLDLSETTQWQAFAITAFSAGLASNAIIQRIWSFMGEKFTTDENVEVNKPENMTDELMKISSLKDKGIINDVDSERLKENIFEKSE